MMIVALGLAALAGQGVAWLVSRLRKYWLRAGVTLALLALTAFDFHPGSAVFQMRPSYFASDEVEAYRWLAEQGSIPEPRAPGWLSDDVLLAVLQAAGAGDLETEEAMEVVERFHLREWRLFLEAGGRLVNLREIAGLLP